MKHKVAASLWLLIKNIFDIFVFGFFDHDFIFFGYW